MVRNLPVIGITLGEPSGIGPEIVDKALASGRLPAGYRYEVIGRVPPGIKPGRLTVRGARAALQALETAADRWTRGELAAVVTAPVQKQSLARVGFGHPGQTEFFAAACGVKARDVVMCLTEKRLTVTLASTHCSLRDALRNLRTPKIIHVGQAAAAFQRKLGKKAPRIAVAGVNPHASEGGLFGDEEERLIIPAVKALRSHGIDASGPHSPDTIFHHAVAGRFDAVVCHYHDQGLIPFKLLAFATGVNVSLGLPLIRTSPDHGTALDLAGRGQADSRSMVEAIRLAARLARRKSAQSNCH